MDSISDWLDNDLMATIHLALGMSQICSRSILYVLPLINFTIALCHLEMVTM